MKIKPIIAFSLSMLLLAGCSKAPAPVETTPTPAPAEAAIEEPVEKTFYTEYKNIKQRPVAVMVDNDNKDAWPHAGLEDAYLVYEVNVEGGATRLMAFFSDTETEKIGPVRSSRHYFLDYAMEHDAIYTHFGWSPLAEKDIPALGINNINGIYDSSVFWREEKYKGDYHSAFTSMEKINKSIKSKEYRTERKNAPLNFARKNYDIGGKSAETVEIPYVSFYNVKFTYNKDNETYSRLMNGSNHPLQSDSEIEAKNIIVMVMPQSSLGDGSARINISDVGKGKGYFISGGKHIPVTWSKSSRKDKTEFKDESGKEIELNHGQTWIEIVSPDTSVTIK